MDGNGQIAAAIDWGGTKLAVGLIASNGTVIDTEQTPTPTSSPAAILGCAQRMLNEVVGRSETSVDELAGLGVSAPGVVDEASGRLLFAPARGWRDVGIAEHVPGWSDRLVRIGNDVDNCLRAERSFGAARDSGTVLWVTVSTGIGGALLHDGKFFRGSGAAGEIGHVVVEDDGPLCGCGNRGCLEAVASGPAIARRALEIGLLVHDARDVARLASGGDPQAQTVLDDSSRAVGLGIAAAINLMDPELIVFGGGVSPSLDLSIIRQTALARSIRVRRQPPAFIQTALGQHASLVGAAGLLFSSHGPS